MKNKYILFFIIFVLILIWFFLLYNIRNNNIESFTSSDNIYAKNKILNNCNLTWGKKNKNQGLCNSSSWVSDPNLLCGICGLDHNNPLYSLKNNDGSTLYGCNENNPNPYQLSWNSKGIQTLISIILTFMLLIYIVLMTRTAKRVFKYTFYKCFRKKNGKF